MRQCYITGLQGVSLRSHTCDTRYAATPKSVSHMQQKGATNGHGTETVFQIDCVIGKEHLWNWHSLKI